MCPKNPYVQGFVTGPPKEKRVTKEYIYKKTKFKINFFFADLESIQKNIQIQFT